MFSDCVCARNAIMQCAPVHPTRPLPSPAGGGGGGGGGLGGNKTEEKRLEQRTGQHFIHQD
jgi:hypothetical protein